MRAVIKFFPSLQGKAPKEIHAILTETLACFFLGRAKDLSAPPVIAQLGKKFSALYTVQKLIALMTRAFRWCLTAAASIPHLPILFP